MFPTWSESCAQLGLEDGDQVDAMIMQTGGRA